MPDNEPSLPAATDRGPVRVFSLSPLEWFWVSRTEFEPPLVGPFLTEPQAINHAETAGYTYQSALDILTAPEPTTENSSAPLNPPEQNEAELKPCPLKAIGWCESEPVFESIHHDLKFVKCAECGTEGKMARDEAAAISAWNKRAT